MSKYSAEQIQAWAIFALNARLAGDPRYAVLQLLLHHQTGLQPHEIDNEIARLAQPYQEPETEHESLF